MYKLLLMHFQNKKSITHESDAILAPTQCQFEHIYNNILCMPIIKSRGLFNIYINHIDIKKEKISCLSQKELVLYDIALVSQ